MSTFQIGDRVRCCSVYLDSSMVLNMEGTVVSVPEDESTNGYGVDWDNLTTQHTCSGRARDGHGWYVRVQALENIDLVIPANINIGDLI